MTTIEYYQDQYFTLKEVNSVLEQHDVDSYDFWGDLQLSLCRDGMIPAVAVFEWLGY
jgi:hypothetical protein